MASSRLAVAGVDTLCVLCCHSYSGSSQLRLGLGFRWVLLDFHFLVPSRRPALQIIA